MKRIITLSNILLLAVITVAQVREPAFENDEYLRQKNTMFDTLNEYLQLGANTSYANSLANRENKSLLKSASAEVELLSHFIAFENGEATARVEFEYDSIGNPKVEKQFVPDDTESGWANGSRYFFGYDENGNRTSMKTYAWLDSLSEWELRSTIEFLYDSKGNNTYSTIYLWYDAVDTITPAPRIVYEHYYNENSLDTLWTVNYYWQGEENVTIQKTKNEYDSLGNLIQSIIYQNNKLSRKEIYNYSYSNGMIVQKQDYRWFGAIDGWEEQFTNWLIYDENENLITDQTFKVDAFTLDTSIVAFEKYEYDLTNPRVWQPFNINHQNRLISISRGSYVDSFYYSAATVIDLDGEEGETETETEGVGVGTCSSASEVHIYPNPVNEVLNLSVPAGFEGSYSIISYTGQTIIRQHAFSESIDVSELPDGIYLLQVKSELGVNTIKFEKK